MQVAVINDGRRVPHVMGESPDNHIRASIGLSTGQVIPSNPAPAVRRRRSSGSANRALVGLMGYTFAPIGAAVQIEVEDY